MPLHATYMPPVSSYEVHKGSVACGCGVSGGMRGGFCLCKHHRLDLPLWAHERLRVALWSGQGARTWSVGRLGVGEAAVGC